MNASAPSAIEILRRNPLTLAGLAMLGIAVLLAALAPILTPYDSKLVLTVSASDIYNPPSASNWFGTDDAGRDVLTNFLYGARVSLIVGFFASLISIIIGGLVGLTAGYFGGRIENILMRFTDFMLVIPDLPLMVVIVALTQPRLENIILVIGLLGWTSTARMVRSQTLAVKSRKFVLRSRAIGAGNLHIIRRHIFPLVLPILAVNAILVVSLAILNESTLSFLGLGDPTVASWGQMLNFAFQRGAMSNGAWWALSAPGFGIIWVVLGLTFLGQGLERTLNPRLESHHLVPGLPSRNPAAAEQTPLGLNPEQGASAPLLQVNNLSVQYHVPGGAPLQALQDIHLTLNPGQVLGLVGESGCGKTTLALSLLRLLPAAGQITSGEILFGGQDLTQQDELALQRIRWKEISIIFQGAMHALNPVRPVGDQIGEAIRRHNPTMAAADLRTRVAELLNLVGISPERQDHFPHQYSGGMRQRAMIAMALACDPQIVIADEPTTALDVMIQAQILELLAGLQARLGLAVILVTHDLGVVAEMCDSVMVMYGGQTAEYAPVDVIFNRPRHPYTVELLRAFPDLTRPEQKLAFIPGSPPRLDALPAGCRFAPRCPLVMDQCHTTPPPPVALADGHMVRCHLAG